MLSPFVYSTPRRLTMRGIPTAEFRKSRLSLGTDAQVDRMITRTVGDGGSRPVLGGLTVNDLDSLVTLEWEGPGAPEDLQLSLTELATAPAFEPDAEIQLQSVHTACPHLGSVLEAIRVLATGPYQYIYLNDRVLVSTRHLLGGWAFVPDDFPDYAMDYTIVFESSANWESGGPMSYDQSEMLIRFDDFYILRSSGDISSEVVAIGTYANEVDAGRAAAECSEFLSVSPEGIFGSTLDEFPDPEY